MTKNEESLVDKKDDGGAAFPGPFSGHCGTESHAEPCGCYVDPGMTLRDYFAIHSLAEARCQIVFGKMVPENTENIAAVAYKIADEMLRHRRVTS